MGIIRSISQKRDWGLGKGSATFQFSCLSRFSGPHWLRSESETERLPRSLILPRVEDKPEEARLRIGDAQDQGRASCQKQEAVRPQSGWGSSG